MAIQNVSCELDKNPSNRKL